MNKNEWNALDAGTWHQLLMPNQMVHHGLRLGPLVGVVNEANPETMLFADLNSVIDEQMPPHLSQIPFKIAHTQLRFMKAELRQFMLDYASRIKKAGNDMHRAVVRDDNPKNRQ